MSAIIRYVGTDSKREIPDRSPLEEAIEQDPIKSILGEREREAIELELTSRHDDTHARH